MTRQPWLKWYPGDWRADPRLRMCSLSARGLWIELIGIAHEADPYGHVVVAGLSPTLPQIAALVGAPVRDVQRALAELKAQGVCSVDDAGRIFSRRMVRDRQRVEQDRENGRRGGNPRLISGVEEPAQMAVSGLTGDPRGGLTPGVKAQMPEARSQKPEKTPETETAFPGLDLGPAQARDTSSRAVSVGAQRASRASRLPAEWPLTDELRRIGVEARERANLPPIDVETEHARFLDYWHAKAGRDAAKVDWLATWRNWCRDSRGSPAARSHAFGEGMRQQMRDAMTLIKPREQETQEWPKSITS